MKGLRFLRKVLDYVNTSEEVPFTKARIGVGQDVGKGFDVELTNLSGAPGLSDIVSRYIGELGVGVLDFLVFLWRVKVS